MALLPQFVDPASFRDPAGQVFYIDGQIFRAVYPIGVKAFETVWKNGILQRLAAQKRMIGASLLDKHDAMYCGVGSDAEYVLSHPKIACITYPYEWSFSTLKSAALAHLDLQLLLLDEDFVLSDASAFNIQFDGTMPLHIDVLSVIPYKQGMAWGGYRQFLQHFLNPLVLESNTGVSFAPFFRASLDGISSDELFRLLPWHKLLQPAFLLHVVMPALGERHYHPQSVIAKQPPALPKMRYRGLLQHLRGIIAKLEPKKNRTAFWFGYADTTSYSTQEAKVKKSIVRAFASSHRPEILLDIGCNSGDFAALAIEAGAKRVVGIDTDRATIDAAFVTATSKKLPFLPLIADIANPSPSQGWRGMERPAFIERVQGDAVIALALIHHLCIGKNIPLSDAITFIISLAPRGLIEFVPKSDPQIVEMLKLREDIFSDYNFDVARESIIKHAHIVAETRISDSGRVLFEFAK